MIDEHGKEQKVQYNEPVPPDFTKSEKVVVIGSYSGDEFHASKILLKCPSKIPGAKRKSLKRLSALSPAHTRHQTYTCSHHRLSLTAGIEAFKQKEHHALFHR